MIRFLAPALALAMMVTPATLRAEDGGFGYLGFGAVGSNDAFGDGDDRWRTANLTASVLFGIQGTRLPPRRFGEMLEFRLSGQVIAPADLDNPDPEDRAYAVSLAFGLHSHIQRGDTQARIGADLVFIGPQTGLDDLQTFSHRRIEGQPSPEVAQRTQIENTTRLAVSGEISHTWRLGERARLRPFAEARIGDETFARIGADYIFGGFGQDAPMLRDTVTGQLYLGQRDGPRGLSVLAGLDVAGVGDSVYLPDDRAADLSETRGRARLGLHWQGERYSVQYGFTYLTPEFEQQDEGQVLGSASVRFAF